MADKWTQFKDNMKVKRNSKKKTGGKKPSVNRILREELLVVQRLSAVVSGKAQKYSRVGAREFVSFQYDEVNISYIKQACTHHYSVPGLVCDVLAGEQDPSCSSIKQVPDHNVIHVRFIASTEDGAIYEFSKGQRQKHLNEGLPKIMKRKLEATEGGDDSSSNNIQINSTSEDMQQHKKLQATSFFKPSKPQNFGIDFLLYTKNNRGSPQKISPNNFGSRFITGAKTFFLIHGFTDNGYAGWIQSMKNELLKLSGSINVVIVNWKVGAAKAYSQSAANTRTVGQRACQLILAIKKNKRVGYNNFHVIGHSLGAHAAGFTGKGVIKTAKDKLGRITGLDPAGFQFARKSASGRLSNTDADFVDVIHTNDGTFLRLAFGYLANKLIGHVDFYPNGGRRQPGCPNVFNFSSSLSLKSRLACSHMRATAYFTNSIKRCQYKAKRCTSGKTLSNVKMGFYASRNLRGKYCIKTTKNAPYCFYETVEIWVVYDDFEMKNRVIALDQEY